jgi:hypothetical protein
MIIKEGKRILNNGRWGKMELNFKRQYKNLGRGKRPFTIVTTPALGPTAPKPHCSLRSEGA